MKRIGFTLTELLVVIAILAVLVAILLPVFASVRRKAQRADCTSNMHQLHIACALYAQNADGFLPPYPSDPRDTPGASGGCYRDSSDLLLAALNPYLHSRDVWHCPSDFSAHTADETACNFPVLKLTSYGYDGFRITSEGIVLMRMDGANNVKGLKNGDTTVWPLFRDTSTCPSDAGYAQYNHGDGLWNVLFLDGHAGTFRLDCVSLH